MTSRRVLPLLLLLALALAGCAGAASSSPPATATSSPRVRCLSDPGEQGTRPLFLFLCIQSP